MTSAVTFAALATVMAVGATLWVLRPLRRAPVPPQPDANAAVLRARLDELRVEHAGGLLSAAELAAAREEVHRRVLAEARGPVAQNPDPVSARTARGAVTSAALALPVLALALYLVLGEPQFLATAGGSAAAADPADPPALRKRLEAHLASRPADARAWVLLARARMQDGLFDAAAAAYRRAIEVQARVARDPQVWCEYADALGMAQGGALAGEPAALIARALALDPDAPCALEMAGSAAVESHDYATALAHWRRLLAQLPAGSARHAELASAVERLAPHARVALPARRDRRAGD